MTSTGMHLIIMKPALNNDTVLQLLLPFDLVNQSMLTGDTPGPISFQVILQRLGFPQALKRISDDIFQQCTDLLGHFFVVIQPIPKVLPGIVGEYQIHLVAFVFSRSFME